MFIHTQDKYMLRGYFYFIVTDIKRNSAFHILLQNYDILGVLKACIP